MSFSVKILGSSGAAPAYDRHHSSQWLEIGKKRFLVDCGEGTQMQLQRYLCRTGKLKRIFISHLHGDHYFGLIGLISSMHLFRQIDELHIYGPKGLDDIIKIQLKYSDTFLNFKLIFHETHPDGLELLYEDSELSVYSFPLQHRVPCTGFLFREKPRPRKIIKERIQPDFSLLNLAELKQGKDILDESGKIKYRNEDYTKDPMPPRSYAYCSDTKYSPEIVEYIHGVDLLYHEATFTNEFEDRALETFHSTAAQAALTAKMAGAKKLIIGHFSARNKELDPLLQEARLVFPDTELAVEGETFELPFSTVDF
ncbi:MAG: ribonuclease Z [Cytophagales bacterium]|nr:ribonuclease Z [Cytophagales bacterium]